MIIYFLNLIWVLIMATLAVNYTKSTTSKSLQGNLSLQDKKILPNSVFVMLILLSLMMVYALRWRTGTDFTGYHILYSIYGKMEFVEIFGNREWGFFGLTSLLYKLWPDNFILYNLVLSALTYIPVIVILRKYSNDFVYTMMLYITMMTYYSPFNGVRQGIATAICFLGYPLLNEKKYFKYICLILVASLFHSSALLIIPLSIIVTQKAWSKTIIVVVALLSLSLIILPNLWTYLIRILELVGLEKMAEDYRLFNLREGVNILRIAVAIMPVMISMIYYKILVANNPKIDLLINMSLMAAIFMIYGSRVTVLARLSTYFFIFNALLIPEFSILFKDKEKTIFKVTTFILFLLYMILLLPVDSQLLPYKIKIDSVVHYFR